MPLYIHNTLTRQKEEFKPIDPKNVRLYACGPTVWNYAHIGNARPVVVFDLLARLLENIYGAEHVSYTRNITDIDDKIIEASRETGVPISEITEKYARIYNEDMGMLGVRPPKYQPKATEYIPQMIAMVEKLIASGNAYAAEGHVLFHVPSWSEYGQLSRRSRDDVIAGARVEIAPYKKDPADFILWKPSTPEQPGWDSPWGRGRPGWHLECSAMNEAINGPHFDIHAGGEDLIFPHHENEIAQSVCAHGGKPYVNYWMHNGFINIDSDKMSKSLGNVRLVHDLVREYKPEALRLVLLSGHYRQPLNFTRDIIEQAEATLNRYYDILRRTKVQKINDSTIPDRFFSALCDDLNTPQALAELAQYAHFSDKDKLLAAGSLVGLLQQDPHEWFDTPRGGNSYQAVKLEDGSIKANGSKRQLEAVVSQPDFKKAVSQWKEFRIEKKYAEADEVKKEFTAYNTSVSAMADGTIKVFDTENLYIFTILSDEDIKK